MIELKCENCGTEILVPKGERAVLKCEMCGGHLAIIKELFKDELPMKDYSGGWKPNVNDYDWKYSDGTITITPGDSTGNIVGSCGYYYACSSTSAGS
jgi:hypothetical protein